MGPKKPLSSTTVLQHHHVLSKALKDAVRLGLIARNPAQAVQPPRPQEHEVNYYNAEEVQKLLESVRETWLHIPVLVAVTTGMRRGETLGVKWSDITLDVGTNKGSLQVRRSLQETKDGLSTKGPKTSSGRRTIPLPSTTVVALRKHKAQQAARRLSMGNAYCSEEWVCAQEDGNVITPSALSAAAPDLLDTSLCVASVSERKVSHGREERTVRESPRPRGATRSGAALEPCPQA